MTAHQQIHAHLRAAERTPHKRAQHLIAATQLAEAAGIPHFGRWSEQSIVRREANRAESQRVAQFKARKPDPPDPQAQPTPRNLLTKDTET